MPDSTRYLLSPQRITDGNEVTLLVDGGQAYPAMLESIAAARRTVNLETYILASDHTGWQFARALADRARAGVEVNLLLDGLGSMGVSSNLLSHMAVAGVRICWYRPLLPWRRGWGWWRRDHKKILVVDGVVGFVGGLNIGDDYADVESGGRGWRDTHARLCGPVVRQLQRAFLKTWRKANGARLDTQRYLPRPDTVGDARAVIMTNGSRGRGVRSVAPICSPSSAPASTSSCPTPTSSLASAFGDGSASRPNEGWTFRSWWPARATSPWPPVRRGTCTADFFGGGSESSSGVVP